MERLEQRLLLTNVSGFIATNTTWTLANSPYVLVGSVVVQSGATLTIEPGVTVSSPLGGVTFSTAPLGTLNANGVTFSGGMTTIGEGSTALLENNVINTVLQIGNGSTTTLTGNLFGSNMLTVHPEFVPNLAGNTFVAGANVNISGGVIDQPITWAKFNGLAEYRLADSVTVQGAGGKLTVAPNLIVSTPIGGDALSTAAGGTLSADGVSFSGAVVSIGADSTALLTNNSFDDESHLEIINGSTGNVLSGNLFDSGVLKIYPEYAPNLAGNTFVTGARVDVSDGVIDEAITWAKVNGLAEYRLVGNVTIQGAGAALTIAPNLTVSNDIAGSGLTATAGGALSADGVTFTASVDIQNDSTATVHFSAFAKTLTISNAAMIDISYNDFSAITPDEPRVVAIGVPSLRNVNLRSNWWGTRTPAEIDDIITDLLDDPSRPRVDFERLLLAPPLRTDLVAAAFSVDPVPAHPLAFQPGDLVTLHFQISNNSPLADVPETRAFFSFNSTAAIPGSKTIELRTVPPIAHQTALPADTLQFTLPPADDPFWTQQPLTTPRYYAIAMRVDALGQLPEWDDPNNLKTLEIPVAANVSGTVIPGDFDFNGTVRSADLAVWAGSFGKQNPDVPLLGDAQADRVVDGRDFLIWQRNLGLPVISTVDENVAVAALQAAAFTAAATDKALPVESGPLAPLSQSLEPRLLPSFTLPDPVANQRAPLSDLVIRDELLRHGLFDSWRRTVEPLPPIESDQSPSSTRVQHGEGNADIPDDAFDIFGIILGSTPVALKKLGPPDHPQ